jgi:hypothetical protein
VSIPRHRVAAARGHTRDDDLAGPDREARRILLDRHADAFTRAGPEALLNLPRADVETEMPPSPTWFTGRRGVVGFLAHRVMRRDLWHMVPIRANGQPAAVAYRHTGDGRHEGCGIQVLTVIGARVSRITAFNDPRPVPAFGLSPALTT